MYNLNMICPICGQEKPVIIKDNKYFCDRCKINIGSVSQQEEKSDQTEEVQQKRNPYSLFNLFSSSKEKENLKRYQKGVFAVFINRVMLASIIILFVFSVIYYLFLYVDFDNKCIIRIYPSIFEFSTRNVIESIKVLKRTSPKDYQNLCQNINVIDTNVGCGGFEGGCYYEHKPGVIHVTTNDVTLTQTIAVMVHETCHAIQHHEGRPLEEQECYEEDQRILQELVVY